MSWLRLDDGFAAHPKIAALTDAEFRGWLRLLCWCAQYRTREIPNGITTVLPGINKKRLDRFYHLGLIDAGDHGYEVHDWETYNPKDPGAADRVRRYRERNPRPQTGEWARTRELVHDRDGGICVDCGGLDETWNADHEPHREDLISRGDSIYDIAFIVTRCHSCHAKKTRKEAVERPNHDRTETEPTTEPKANGSVPSRVGTRARPVPSRKGTQAVPPTRNAANGNGLTALNFEEMAKAVNQGDTR